SPAIWEKVADFCLLKNIQLNTVKYTVMFGAPVRNEIIEKFSKILPNGDTYTPYGATEGLPLTKVSGKDILSKFKNLTINGKGTCVGRAVNGINLKVIKINEQPINQITSDILLDAFEVGEIIANGKNVTKSYYQNKLANEL